VEEDEAAVDESTEVDVPADPHLVLGDFPLPREAHLRRIVLLGHGEEVVKTGEMDDLAVVGGCDLGHRGASPKGEACTAGPHAVQRAASALAAVEARLAGRGLPDR
jgi:hypothetical protein